MRANVLLQFSGNYSTRQIDWKSFEQLFQYRSSLKQSRRKLANTVVGLGYRLVYSNQLWADNQVIWTCSGGQRLAPNRHPETEKGKTIDSSTIKNVACKTLKIGPIVLWPFVALATGWSTWSQWAPNHPAIKIQPFKHFCIRVICAMNTHTHIDYPQSKDYNSF